MTYVPTKGFSTNRIEESGQNILLTKHPLKIGYSVPDVVTKCNSRKNCDLPRRNCLKGPSMMCKCILGIFLIPEDLVKKIESLNYKEMMQALCAH